MEGTSESRWIENPMFAPLGVLSEAVSHAQPSQVRTPGFQMPPLPKKAVKDARLSHSLAGSDLSALLSLYSTASDSFYAPVTVPH